MYRTSIYIIDHVNFLPPSTRGGVTKNSELNVRFFWNRLYTLYPEIFGPLWFSQTLPLKLNLLFRLGEDYRAVEWQVAPDFLSHSCSPQLHPEICYYSMGKYVDKMEISESLVLRFNVDDVPAWPPLLSKNLMKNFINKYVSEALRSAN